MKTIGLRYSGQIALQIRPDGEGDLKGLGGLGDFAALARFHLLLPESCIASALL